MALTVGTRLGHYDVVALLGEGGMGQVWQATDTQLHRQVALKILPDAFADDPDRLARFRREAQILASLNHPNIAAIFGIEEAEGTRALVLELVEGPTLADRIAKGPIPLDEALPIAKQIAEALEAAHEAGVIHRDLKPANIKVREDGAVKVLDFGLATALDPDPEGDPSESPTLTAAATQMGVIMGTSAYMSPEQASGETADKRSDIWSFGVVLYEMLTGQRLFTGKTVAHVMASVLKTDPDWTVLPTTTPQPLTRLLRRCLEKEPKRRLRDVSEAVIHLEETATAPAGDPSATAATASQPTGWRQTLPLALGMSAIAVIIAGLAVWTLKPPPPQPVSRTVVSVAPSAAVTPSIAVNDVAISPDGTRMVYQAGPEGQEQLVVRVVDQLHSQPLGGLERPEGPFLSSEGSWVGFTTSSGRRLQTVSILGGPPVTIVAEAPGRIRGASWGNDDVIVFSVGGPGEGLLRVSAAGGDVETIATLEEGRALWPDVLPNGAGVLFTIDTFPQAGGHQVAVLDYDTGEYEVIIPNGSHAKYSPTGHIVYGFEGTLRAATFDLATLTVTGNPVPVVEDVLTKDGGAASFDLADTGSLVYVASAASATAALPLHDIGNQDGIDFLVMEYLEGETLAQRLEKGALPLDQAVRLVQDICDLEAGQRPALFKRERHQML